MHIISSLRATTPTRGYKKGATDVIVPQVSLQGDSDHNDHNRKVNIILFDALAKQSTATVQETGGKRLFRQASETDRYTMTQILLYI